MEGGCGTCCCKSSCQDRKVQRSSRLRQPSSCVAIPRGKISKRLTSLRSHDIPAASALPSPTSAPDSPAPLATPGKSLPPAAAAAAASTLPPASANATASTSEAKPTPPPAGQRRESLNGAPRTVKTDAVHLGGKFDTGDEGRNKCIELTYDALASDSNARESGVYPEPCDRS